MSQPSQKKNSAKEPKTARLGEYTPNGEANIPQLLQATEAALAREKRCLAETNIALNVLLKKRELDRFEIEEQVLANVRQLIEPIVSKLQNSGLNSQQKAYVEILATNLREIISPFVRSHTSQNWSLTPTEIQVANFVKMGKTSKEIAELMNISPKTIDVHRKNIRKKSGIKNKKINLRSILSAAKDKNLP